MVAYPRTPRLTIPIAPAAAIGAFTIVAVTALAIPASALDALVVESGIPALIGAAEPPLGLTARIVLTLGVGGFVAAVVWAALFLLIGQRSVAVHRFGRFGTADQASPDVPAIRRADAHPDAPPRRPLFAEADLGTPFLDVKAAPVVERTLPRDLDIPLAPFDPDAILPVPRAPAQPVDPLVRGTTPLSPGGRIETFELTPMVRPAPGASIDVLLDRLEQGARRQRPQPRSASLEATLASLRQMAMRAG